MSPLLLQIARSSIAAELGMRTAMPSFNEIARLSVPGSSFVTIRLDGTLRGAAGTVDAHRPLGKDISENARSAAVSDPRFPPLTPDELERALIEVSVVGPLRDIPADSVSTAASALRPRVDGATLASRGRRGTLLPEMWGDADGERFVHLLLDRAHVPAAWPSDARLRAFEVETVSDAPSS